MQYTRTKAQFAPSSLEWQYCMHKYFAKCFILYYLTYRNPETASLTKAMEKISRSSLYALEHLA